MERLRNNSLRFHRRLIRLNEGLIAMFLFVYNTTKYAVHLYTIYFLMIMNSLTTCRY